MTATHRAFLIIPGIVILLAVLAIRVVWSGRESLETARQCAAIGLDNTAINFYVRSARWHMPFLTTSQDAIEGLLDISGVSSARQDHKTALKALREARAAILGTRWLFTPGIEHLPTINRTIAELMAAEAEPGSPASDVDANLALLEKTALPNPWISLFASLLFMAWLPITVFGAFKSVTAEGRFTGRTGLPWISLSAGLLCGWLLLVAIA